MMRFSTSWRWRPFAISRSRRIPVLVWCATGRGPTARRPKARPASRRPVSPSAPGRWAPSGAGWSARRQCGACRPCCASSPPRLGASTASSTTSWRWIPGRARGSARSRPSTPGCFSPAPSRRASTSTTPRSPGWSTNSIARWTGTGFSTAGGPSRWAGSTRRVSRASAGIGTRS